MEEVASALRELADSNKQLLARIDAIEEQQRQKDLLRRRNYFEMDVKFIMDWKRWDREKAVQKLQSHQYDVAKVIQSSMSQMFRSDAFLEHVLAHYEYKKNRRIIEGW